MNLKKDAIKISFLKLDNLPANPEFSGFCFRRFKRPRSSLKHQSKYGNIKRLEACMSTNVQECIKPISYIKTNAADMINFVNDRKEPLIITQNGESRAVLIDVESYQEMKNAFTLVKIMQLSEKDVKAGKTKPASEVFANLRRQYKLGN